MDVPERITARHGGASSRGPHYRCPGCGEQLTDHEHFLGGACERCERDFLAEQDEDDYPRAA